jgi:hypothetical protein
MVVDRVGVRISIVYASSTCSVGLPDQIVRGKSPVKQKVGLLGVPGTYHLYMKVIICADDGCDECVGIRKNRIIIFFVHDMCELGL